MDIFNWLSLLISSFLLGVISLFFLFGSLIFPSYQWKNSIVDDELIRKHFFTNNNCRLLNYQYLKKVTFYYFLIPLVINNLLLIFVIYIFKTDFWLRLLFILFPICLGGISTVFLLYQSYQFRLSYKIFFYCAAKISILIFLSSFLCMIISLPIQCNIHQNINKLSKEYLFDIISLASIFIVNYIIGKMTLALLKEDKQAKLSVISILIILFIFLSGILVNISGMVVKVLNIGNYQASHVYLTPESCQRLKETQLFEISQQCSLENIKVLWDIGGSYFFKVAVNGELQILSLDKKEIIAVLKSKKPSTACRTQPTEAPIDNSLSHSH